LLVSGGMAEPSTPVVHEEHTLRDRIAGEFLEMPGMRITLAQAQRLWHVDVGTARRLLETLVSAGFLWESRSYYQRTTTGRRAA
jgi:hypothetical protein